MHAHMHICTIIHTHICTHTHVYTEVYRHIQIHICIDAVNTYTHTLVNIYQEQTYLPTKNDCCVSPSPVH